MPDNPSPAAQPESSSGPVEFNFDKPASENPRIKRRSLKAKASGLKPATAPAAARELEREAPPLPAESVSRPAAPLADDKPTLNTRTELATRTTPVAPPRTTPLVSATSPATAAGVSGATTPRPASTSATVPAHTATQKPATTSTNSTVSQGATAPKTASAPTASTSPHGTRPATLYYSSYPKKETSSSMKSTTTAGPAASSTSSSTSAAQASSAARSAPLGSTAAARPATANIDYRANVERQSREQKSVGNILAYFVYGLITLFVLGAGLAVYGSVIIFGKLHDQSATLSDLDAKYALKVNALTTQITTTQDTLAQAQAQIAREQELINRQQEDLNRLLAAMTDNANAIKSEKQARAQETAALRARVRDLEYRNTTTQKF